MKAPFGRKAATDGKPVSIVFTGTNGGEVTEWSRDADTIARFQHRPELPEEPARVLLLEPHRYWAIVPVGATIRLKRDDSLELILPDAETPEED